VYNVLFTCLIIIPIALLNQSDGRTIYLLAVFAVYWITLSTLGIVFAPKVITIYKDASGILAQRISDSKASASELAARSAQTGRTIKDLAQQPIRLMDRVTLRTYVNLLEKELTAARAALATLDANEGVLAGGGGHGAYRTLAPTVGSAPNSRLDTTGGMAPGAAPRSTLQAAGTNAGRAFSTTGGSSPKAASGTPLMVRTGSTVTGTGASAKYATTPQNVSGTSTPILGSLQSSTPVPNIRSIASVAPASILSAIGTTRSTSPAGVNVGITSTGAPMARTHLSAIEMKAMPVSPSNAGGSSNGSDSPLAAASIPGASPIGSEDHSSSLPNTRFRMPASTSGGHIGLTSPPGPPLLPPPPPSSSWQGLTVDSQASSRNPVASPSPANNPSSFT
jgi:hypothetical protein